MDGLSIVERSDDPGSTPVSRLGEKLLHCQACNQMIIGEMTMKDVDRLFFEIASQSSRVEVGSERIEVLSHLKARYPNQASATRGGKLANPEGVPWMVTGQKPALDGPGAIGEFLDGPGRIQGQLRGAGDLVIGE